MKNSAKKTDAAKSIVDHSLAQTSKLYGVDFSKPYDGVKAGSQMIIDSSELTRIVTSV